MGSAESKQADARLQQASLSDVTFPTRFNLYYQGKARVRLILGEDKTDAAYVISLPGGWYGNLVLYNGPTSEAAPLAVIRSGRKMGFHDVVDLAAPQPGQRPIREELRTHGNKWSMAYAFVIATRGPDALPEKFEWRGSRGDEVKSLGEYFYGWKLLRLGRDEEVVAVGAEAKLSRSFSKAGAFQFLGSGATGELGAAWSVLAVASFVRIVQKQMQAAISASSA
ncbi:hypothetical protein CDD83_10366 [Cordyceps sp. RAO-2017]|nr:hypothetical protein CDD83_10366 [Cordyceps sp. RAO-2017]